MIRWYIKFFFFKRKWKKANSHNNTYAESMFNMNDVSVGNNTYGGISVLTYNNINKLSIGHYCSIGPEVWFILSADHYVDRISSYPFKNKIIDGSLEGISKGNILIDDDVWIGHGAKILSGVHIGQGAVVAAGAVVTKNVPPYAIVGGVPAKIIKYRFSDDIINYFMNLDYRKLDENLIKEHIDELYTPVDNLSIDDIKKLYDWFPKK